jgi:serine/threonine protein kinase
MFVPRLVASDGRCGDGFAVQSCRKSVSRRRAGSVHDGVRSAQIGLGRLVRPPEQVEGKVDARMDLFAFGCVLYEMLTGRRAFTGETGASLMSAILRRSRPTSPRSCPRRRLPRSPRRTLPAEGSVRSARIRRATSPKTCGASWPDSAASRESICRRSGFPARPAPRLSNSFSLCCERRLS